MSLRPRERAQHIPAAVLVSPGAQLERARRAGTVSPSLNTVPVAKNLIPCWDLQQPCPALPCPSPKEPKAPAGTKHCSPCRACSAVLTLWWGPRCRGTQGLPGTAGRGLRGHEGTSAAAPVHSWRPQVHS